MQHSCGSARCQRSCVGQGPPHHLRPRSSKVRLRRGSTGLLFLQALCHFCSALGPRCASGRARQKRHRAFRAGRKQPSAFAPGCWRRGCRPAPAHSVRQPLRPSPRDLSLGLRPLLQSLAPVLRHCLPPSHAARHPLRRSALRIGLSASYLDSSGSACSRRPSYPASPSSRAHSFGPFRPRPRRESARPQRRSLPLLQGALRLPSTALQSPSPTTLPDTLRGHAPLASLVPRPWSLGDSKPGSRPDLIKKGNEITRIADPP